MQTEKLIKRLNSKFLFVRRSALKQIKAREGQDESLMPRKAECEANLNVHTSYSFAPYSPTMAAYMAYKSGLSLVGSCDYGTTAGYAEFSSACKVLGISSVPAVELTLDTKRLGRCTASFYCVPTEKKNVFEAKLASFRNLCRQRAMDVCKKINQKLESFGIVVDFEKEVAVLCDKKGGTLTLKHVYMAVGKKITEKYGRGRATADFLRDSLCLDIEEGSYNLLCDANDPFYLYDMISTLRFNFKNVEANVNPPSAAEYVSLAHDNGVICAYQYDCSSNWLRNRTESEKIIAEFTDMLALVKQEGFNAVCVSAQNLSEGIIDGLVKALYENDLLAVFTEKTEYPRDHFSYVAPERSAKYFETCAYAIMGNGISRGKNVEDGIFSDKASIRYNTFDEKLRIFSSIGKKQL